MRKRFANSDSFQAVMRLALMIFGLYTIVALLLIMGIWFLISQDREHEQQRQEAELISLARALEEHVVHTFGQLDNTLQSLANVMGEGKHINGELDLATIARLREQAVEWSLRVPQAATLSVTTSDNKPVITAPQRDLPYNVFPPSPAIKLWSANPQGAMRIMRPLKLGNAFDQNWFIPAERGATGSNGEFLGVVHALINAKYFEKFYNDIRLSQQDSISLLTADGVVLFHYPIQDKLMGALFSDNPIFDKADQRRVSVVSDSFSAYETDNLTAFRRLTEYPLIVVVSRPESVAFASFREMRRRLLFGASALIVLLACLAWISFYDAQRREAARIELGRMNTALEARVGRRTAELEQSNRELIAFSYSISHDLRAPLRAINGFAHAVREDYGDRLDEQGREYLERIYRASVRMGELIDELLSLANVSRQPLTVQRVDLSAIAQEIMDELKLAEPNRSVKFEAQQGMRTEGDEALLRNALSNLLHNAWKFTRSRYPAIITVTASDEAEHERFVVADNGVGFDMSHAKRLFQPFQQLHTNQGFAGTGIGLASVRRIIERHGGRIWAESSPDQGARFVIELPHRAAVMRRRRGAKTPEGSTLAQMDDNQRLV